MGTDGRNRCQTRAAGTRLPATRTGVYRPRRPQASPLYRLVEDHFAELVASCEERFEHRYGPWRPVVREVVEKFLDCGLLEPGFARVRCGDCGAEFLLAFSCKCRYFCPSCHAKRLALWCDWLERELLLPIPHRQYVFTVPKRLRPYFLYDRRLSSPRSRPMARSPTGIPTCTCSPPTAPFVPTARSCRSVFTRSRC